MEEEMSGWDGTLPRDWNKEIEEAAKLMKSMHFPEIAQGHRKAADLLVDLVREIVREMGRP